MHVRHKTVTLFILNHTVSRLFLSQTETTMAYWHRKGPSSAKRGIANGIRVPEIR